MGNCCGATVKAAEQVVKFVQSAVIDRLGFFLYSKLDGTILRYYLRNLDKIITDHLPFRDDDELLFFNGTVVNSETKELAGKVDQLSAGQRVTVITARPSKNGKYTYYLVKGVLEDQLFPDLESNEEKIRPPSAAPRLSLRAEELVSTTDDIIPQDISVGYLQSYVQRNRYFKYDPLLGSVAFSTGLNQGPAFLFWRCEFYILSLLRAGLHGVREAYRPQSFPLFISVSGNGVQWQYQPTGPKGHPLNPTPDMLFDPIILQADRNGDLTLGFESHTLKKKYLRMSDDGFYLDDTPPNVSAEAIFHFRRLNSDP